MSERHFAWLLWGDEPIGGVRRALINFAAGLRARGWRISMICLDKGELAATLRAEGYAVHCLHSDGDHHRRYATAVAGHGGRLRGLLHLRRYRSSLHQTLARLRPDAMSLYWPDFLLLAGACCRSLRIPLLWELPEVPSVHRFRLNQRLYALALRHYCIRPIANSRFTAGRLGPVPGLTVVYPPSDPQPFEHPHPIWQRADFGLPATAILLGSIARLSPQKSGENLIRALALLADEQPQLHLIWIGGPLDSAYADQLRGLRRQLGLDARVHFLGEAGNPAAAHALPDLFISCRPDPEGFGLSIVEAMLSGKPVLARALGGPAETVVDGETGWHFHDDHPAAIAQALRRALADRPRWPQLGARGRDRARATFCLDQSLPRYEQTVLAHIADVSGRPP